MLRSKFFSGLFILCVFSSLSTIKQQPPVNKLNKELIGSKWINFSTDHDVIFNMNGQFPFSSIILQVMPGQVQMNYLKIYYNSGNVQDVAYSRLLKSGTINVGTPLTENGLSKIEFGYVKVTPVTGKGKPHPHKSAKLFIWGYY